VEAGAYWYIEIDTEAGFSMNSSKGMLGFAEEKVRILCGWTVIL